MDCSTAKYYSSDRDSYHCPEGPTQHINQLRYLPTPAYTKICLGACTKLLILGISTFDHNSENNAFSCSVKIFIGPKHVDTENDRSMNPLHLINSCLFYITAA